MTLIPDITINLVSAGLAGGATAAWFAGRRTWRHRNSRAFWKFLEEPTLFVVGELPSDVLLNTLEPMLEKRVGSVTDPRALVKAIVSHVQDQEISGLIGRGDFDAIATMVARFAALNLPPEPRIVAPNDVTKAMKLANNLVLIGGKDVNSLTEEYYTSLGCELEPTINDEGRNMVRDHQLNVDHVVSPTAEDSGIPHTVVDYGVLVRGRSPLNSEREVVIIAGAHGLGTLAAAEVSVGEGFQSDLRHYLNKHKQGFECLVEYKRNDTARGKGHPEIRIFPRKMAGVSPP